MGAGPHSNEGKGRGDRGDMGRIWKPGNGGDLEWKWSGNGVGMEAKWRQNGGEREGKWKGGMGSMGGGGGTGDGERRKENWRGNGGKEEWGTLVPLTWPHSTHWDCRGRGAFATCKIWNGKIRCGENLAQVLKYRCKIWYKFPNCGMRTSLHRQCLLLASGYL